MLNVRLVDYGTPEYRRTLALRDKILRAPLGLKFDEAFLAQEKNPGQYHVAACDGDTVLGCLILTDIGDGFLKMRQVAVDDTSQGRGVGRALVDFSERFGRERGFKEIVLNARETAAPFYTRLSYDSVSDVFTEVGIPHRKMRKIL